MNEKHKVAIDKAYNKLLNLSSDEFEQLLKEHEDGDFANIILETGALDVGNLERDGFTQNNNIIVSTEFQPQEYNSPIIYDGDYGCTTAISNRVFRYSWADNYVFPESLFADYELPASLLAEHELSASLFADYELPASLLAEHELSAFFSVDCAQSPANTDDYRYDMAA